jgi:hypothetical protein
MSRRPPIRPLSLLTSAFNLHMTMTMTLCLAKKVLVHRFETLEISSTTGSMVLILFHDQQLRSTSGLRASGVSTFLACLLPERFYPKFMICRQVSSHRSMVMNRFGSSSFRSFQNFPPTLSPRVLSPEVDDPSMCVFWNQRSICTLSFGPSGVFDPMQPITYFPTGVPVSGLHDLSPCGEILEADTWPNQAGDTCHILTDISILQMPKTY